MTFNDNIRIQLLGENDTNVLSDVYVTLQVNDAKEITGISSDNMALRYYSCYLIALNWDSIGAVKRREGVEYIAPDPNKYLNLYENVVSSNLTSSEDLVAGKESTNVGNIISDNGTMIKGSYPE